MKKCNKCDELKPLTEFYRGAKGIDGRRSVCKVCEQPMRKDLSLRRKFGISHLEYDEMFKSQDGVCAICGKPETRYEKPGTSTDLCVDHDHRTDEVRGLLCRTCNSMLGLAGDDPDILFNAINYLKRYGKIITT